MYKKTQSNVRHLKFPSNTIDKAYEFVSAGAPFRFYSLLSEQIAGNRNPSVRRLSEICYI